MFSSLWVVLRTLTFCECRNPEIFIRALQPSASASKVIVCPKLEELVLVVFLCETMFHITRVIEMAARGEKPRTVRIVGGRNAANFGVSELRKHVWSVEYNSRLDCEYPFDWYLVL